MIFPINSSSFPTCNYWFFEENDISNSESLDLTSSINIQQTFPTPQLPQFPTINHPLTHTTPFSGRQARNKNSNRTWCPHWSTSGRDFSNCKKKHTSSDSSCQNDPERSIKLPSSRFRLGLTQNAETNSSLLRQRWKRLPWI